MILHRALRYLVLTRWKNRLRMTLRKLKTPTGMLGAVLILAVVGSLALGSGFGRTVAMGERASVFVAILAFLMIMGILSGIGQRGLVFLAADLEYLLPTPIPRRHVLLYHFVPHYLAAAFMALLYVFVLGGRFLPHPLAFFVGVLLCQMTNAHLSALSAEISMVLGDRLYRLLRGFATALVVVCVLAALLFLIGGIADVGGVTPGLRSLVDSPAAQVIFFPAVKAVHLGAHPNDGVRLVALLTLVACAAASFLLVLALRVDFVESSFHATRKACKRVDQMRRGVRTARVRRSAGRPTIGLFRGAGAVLWLNLLTMRRQLRSALGGLIVVLVMLAVFSRERGGPAVAHTVLVMLGMVPLWMPLPVGFRLPREQLLVLCQLPLAPARLAAALLTVPVLVPFLLQTCAVLMLVGAGRLEPLLGLAILPAYVAVGATMVAVESSFVLRRPHPNAINLLHSVAQVVLQLAALLPGLLAAALLGALGAAPPALLVGSALVQTGAVSVIARLLGRQLQVGAVAAAA